MRLPKILMFTPVYSGKDYCLEEWLDSVDKFTYKNLTKIIVDNSDDDGVYYESLKKRLEPRGYQVYHVARGASSREALARSQNFGRKVFLEGDYDYFFSLESDVFAKPNIVDALVSHNLDIVTAVYMIGHLDNGTRTPCITVPTFKEDKGTWGTRLLAMDENIEYINKGVKLVSAGGWGCSLIYRKVMEEVGFTYIPGHVAHSDVFFFLDAARLGYLCIVDTDIFCEHKNSKWEDVKDR